LTLVASRWNQAGATQGGTVDLEIAIGEQLAASRTAYTCSNRRWDSENLSDQPSPVSTTLENEAIATVENEATHTDWMG
jgi:hypothetical protein